MGRKTPPSKESQAKMQEASKATRFNGECANKKRQDIPGAPIPWEVRKAYGTLCRAPIDLTKPDAVNRALEHINGKGKVPTGAQAIAAAVFLKALKGDLSAAEMVTVNNEGKLPDNININSTGSITHKNTPLEGDKKAAAIEELLRFAAKFKQPPTKQTKEK